MSGRYRSRWLMALVVAVGVSVLAVPAVMAEDDSEEQVEQLRQQLESLQDDTDEQLAEEEFDTAFKWLEEAEHFAQQGSTRGVEQRIRRVDHMLDLLRAVVQTRQIKQSIEQQEQSYETSVEQLERLEAEIEDLEEQKAERQRELEQIREDL